MSRRAPWLALAALPFVGCATQADIDRAVSDDLRLTGRVMGFSLDAAEQALTTRLAVLRAFEGDPRYQLLEEALGTVADNEAKLERVRGERRSLLEEAQKLNRRYQGEE